MNETGRKTFFWYRVYCALYAFLGLLTVCFGLVFAFGTAFKTGDYNEQELITIGLVYVAAGLIGSIIYTIAFLLPPKPYNWIVGIILIIFQLSNCLLLPIFIPLLIFWLKPETKAFFGRS